MSGTQTKGNTERKTEQQSVTLLVVYRRCAINPLNTELNPIYQ